MRILFLSNFYPPYSQGGYEQLCQEVAQLLAARGHTLCVLTGRTKGVSSVEEDGPVRVHRRLELELEGGLGHTVVRLAFGGREASERRNVATVERVIDEFRPDAALIWGMWNVPRSVPAAVERLLPERVAYYLCDYWPVLPNAYIQRLEAPARRGHADWAKRGITQLLLPAAAAEMPTSLSFKRAACVSYALRDALVHQGTPLDNAQIIHNGIYLSDFSVGSDAPSTNNSLRLIYSGRLSPEKGLHVALEALALLDGSVANRCELLIAGGGDEDYLRHLRTIATRGSVPVTFLGHVGRANIPRLLSESQVLIFPSEWGEPLARAVIEAMAAGLAVIGTTTGGTGEILVEGKTGLTFRPGDPADLARQITWLAADPRLRERLAAAGQALVLREFDIRSTVDQLESLLCQATIQSESPVA